MAQTTTQHYIETPHWTGVVPLPDDLGGDDREAWLAAMAHLGSHETALAEDGDLVYLAAETGRYYRVTTDEVLDLGRRSLAGESDVYSLWCSETTADEHETLADALA